MADRMFETRLHSAPGLEIRETDAGYNFDGVASVFNDVYQVGYFDERTLPTTFARTLGRKPDVRLLVDHEGQPLARTSSGTLSLSDTEGRGLRAFTPESTPLDKSDPDVQRLAPKMRRGDLTNMSFAFRVMDGGDEWDYSGDRPLRTLRHVDLHGGDVSIVTYPASPGTHSTLRADTGRQEASWVLADAMLLGVRRGQGFEARTLRHLHAALEDLGLTLRDVKDVDGLRDARADAEADAMADGDPIAALNDALENGVESEAEQNSAGIELDVALHLAGESRKQRR